MSAAEEVAHWETLSAAFGIIALTLDKGREDAQLLIEAHPHPLDLALCIAQAAAMLAVDLTPDRDDDITWSANGIPATAKYRRIADAARALALEAADGSTDVGD